MLGSLLHAARYSGAGLKETLRGKPVVILNQRKIKVAIRNRKATCCNGGMSSWASLGGL